MQHKDTSQQAFLIIYLMCIYHLFTFHLVDLGEFSPWPRLMSDSEVKTGAFTFGLETLPHLLQIKSLLLSHHHSTSALVSEILMSVLQTVQKNNNRQFTYGQTVQKTALEHLQCSRQCKKTTTTIYIWTDSAKNCTGAFTVLQTVQKTTTTIYIWTDSAKNCTGAFTVLQTVQKNNNNNLHMDRQCKKLHWSIYSAPDSAKKQQQQFTYGQTVQKTALEHLQCSRQCKKNNNRQFTYGQTVQKTALEHLQCSRQCKKTTTTIYIWTDSAKNCTGAFTVLQTVQKNNNNNLHMHRQCKKQQQFTYGQYIFTDCTEDNVQNTHTYTQYT